MVDTTNMEELARVWLAIQAARDELKSKYDKDDAELEAEQEMVNHVLGPIMAKMKVTSQKTAAGVIERKPQMKVSAADWEAIYRFVYEQKAWGLLHKRLASTFVEEWADTHKDADGNRTLPPGVNVYQAYKVVVKPVKSRDLPKSEG